MGGHLREGRLDWKDDYNRKLWSMATPGKLLIAARRNGGTQDMEISLRPFEEAIADDFGHSGHWAPRKGIWIKGHLLDKGENYSWHMWRCYQAFCAHTRIRPGTFRAFTTFMFTLRKLGLIEPTGRVEPGEKVPEFERVYYRVAPGKEDVVEWTRPMQSLYPSTDWTALSGTEKAELHTRYPRKGAVPGRLRGRPRRTELV